MQLNNRKAEGKPPAVAVPQSARERGAKSPAPPSVPAFLSSHQFVLGALLFGIVLGLLHLSEQDPTHLATLITSPQRAYTYMVDDQVYYTFLKLTYLPGENPNKAACSA